MPIDITLEIAWWERLSRRIEGIEADLSNLWPFFKKAVDILSDKADEIFSTEGKRLVGRRWRPLSPSTIKARQRRWWYYKLPPNNPSVLRWTWNLQDNRTKTSSNSWWQLIFNAPYAWYQHPKRKLIELDPKTSAEIIRALQVHINNKQGIRNIRL